MPKLGQRDTDLHQFRRRWEGAMLYLGLLSKPRAVCGGAPAVTVRRARAPATPRPEIERLCTSMNLTEIRRDAEHRWALRVCAKDKPVESTLARLTPSGVRGG